MQQRRLQAYSSAGEVNSSSVDHFSKDTGGVWWTFGALRANVFFFSLPTLQVYKLARRAS